MDQDFFQQGQYQQATIPAVQPSSQNEFNQEDNAWQQVDPQVQNANLETTHTLGSNHAYNSNSAINFASDSNVEIDDQVTRKIRQEQERIQQILRQKANKEYEEKQARKQAGRQQIVEFLQKKQKQLDERKQSNVEHQRQLIQKSRQLNQTAGWKKVSENLDLKQGEYKGTKQVNRMRQSIINKRQDQASTN